MRRKALWGGVVMLVVALGAGASMAHAQVLLRLDRPEQARFLLLTEDPMAFARRSADGSHATGYEFMPQAKVWTVQDKATGLCTLLFFTANAMTASGPSACPVLQ